MRRNQYYVLYIFLITTSLFSLSGCSVIKSAFCSLRSTERFVSLETDSRVRYEPGAEAFAEQMSELLPEAIKEVEAGHYRPFAKPVTIYICASQESYTKITGLKAPASMTLKGVFFSPRLVEEERPLLLYLAHELSHLHLEQRIGQYKFARLPAWFKEGLAALVSDGGGAHLVTELEAVESFRSGRHFEPHKKGRLFFRKYAHHWGLRPHMFYRQSMMFVAYLRDCDEKKYRDLLSHIQDGSSFADSFNMAYGVGLMDVWKQFLLQI